MKNVWRAAQSYIEGASTATNPLPTTNKEKFVRNDRIALQQDFQAIGRDIRVAIRRVNETANRK